jgi:hypothetical protein
MTSSPDFMLGSAWPPQRNLSPTGGVSQLGLFALLCRVVAEFSTSLSGPVFTDQSFKGSGISGKVSALGGESLASIRSGEG